MSPEPMDARCVDDDHIAPKPQQDTGSKKLELLSNGYYYDVTSFVERHPGGPIIQMYLNNCEDATQAIQQFHARSRKRVDAIMNSFPKRKATDADLIQTWGPDRVERHRALTRDFESLYKELQDDGLFEPSLSHVLMRYLEITTIGSLGLYLFSAGYTAIGVAFVCWAAGRSTWFVHEAGHHSLTGKPWLDRWMQSHIYGIYCGCSGASWRNHHSQHHAMPQHIHNDIDLHTLPLFAFHERVVTKKEQFGFFVKYQKYFIYIIQSSIMGFYWKWVEDPVYAWKNGYYWDLVHMGIHQIFVYKLGLPLYLLSGCIVLSYMVLQATLSHTHLPITEDPTHWVEYGLVHTANVRSSWWVDYIMGYLNYQIEHHLFPTMPQFRNKLAAKRVKELARKHGLPYHLYDYKTIVIKTLTNLSNVSDDVEKRIKQEEKQEMKVAQMKNSGNNHAGDGNNKEVVGMNKKMLIKKESGLIESIVKDMKLHKIF
ncbi:acyl-lipid (8-3)-desaturase-like [Folsomia candida]|nr:acyl-lipid (8-3)-desaturase-like [Folsomia candida]